MVERPILFSGPMVRAILDDRKTVTRRVVSLREFGPTDTRGYDWCFRDKRGLWNDVRTERLLELSPYGQASDRLWVRETWFSDPHQETKTNDPGAIHFRATEPECYRVASHGGWKPSIFMPRWACRILLDVVSVRVERLHDITCHDVVHEGISLPRCNCEICAMSSAMCPADAGSHLEEFAALWDSINSKRGFGWSKNPWVWRVEFRRQANA